MILNCTGGIRTLGLLWPTTCHVTTACAVVDLRYNDGHSVSMCLCGKNHSQADLQVPGGQVEHTLKSIMDKHLKVLYIKVPSIHSPLHYEVIYNTTQVMSELQLLSISFGKSNILLFAKKIWSVSEECGA